MIERRLFVTLKGEEVSMPIRYQINDWRKPLSAVHRLGIDIPWLVIFDQRKSAVLVSNEAPFWYIPLAVLHETIYHGNFYVDIIEQMTDGQIKIVDGIHRCVNVERFILSIADKHRTDYIVARIKLFETILESKYRPIPEEQMFETLEMLRQEEALEQEY